MSGRFVLGLNQYTHSAAACLVNENGRVVAALEKERLTRKKHDGGDTSEVVRALLAAHDLSLSDIGVAVANNHLFRIREFESKLPWEVAQNTWPPSYLDPCNLLPGVPRHELSHHLAHAWSVLPVAPFDEGLIVVMDGMGSMLADVQSPDAGYTTDEVLKRARGFREVWPKGEAGYGFREAESVYAFRGRTLQRLFKRWTAEVTPPLLPNYGFHDMDSLGAVYSRVSSHIFGDWNACGKVMGLAPWHEVWNRKFESRRTSLECKSTRLLAGSLHHLVVNRDRLRTEPHPHEWGEVRRRRHYASLAHTMQADLESIVLPFLWRLRRETGAKNLALAGGVALNSTLNGRIVREAGFEQVFIPPYPGDEGIAIGCALFGYHSRHGRSARPRLRSTTRARNSPAATRQPLPATLGLRPSNLDVELALEAWAPWILVIVPEDEHGDIALQKAAEALAQHEVVGWFQGPDEFGPRALGNRSILAHPGRRTTSDRINLEVKRRESFRPFAPAVLLERAAEFFDLAAPSPFMSGTASVRKEFRRRLRAVTHVDGSARVQTVARDDHPRFYALIETFATMTKLPILLNTSFNVGREPIVHTPDDALRSFLDGGLDLLILESCAVRPRPFPTIRRLARVCPKKDLSVTSNVTSSADGVTLSALLMAQGKVFETDALGLALFLASEGREAALSLARRCSRAGRTTMKSAVDRLQSLYRWRLIQFV